MVDLRKVLNESTSEPTSVAGYSRLKEGEELIVELLENVVLCRLSGSDKVQGIQEGLRWLLDKVSDKKAWGEQERERQREREWKRWKKTWKKWVVGEEFVEMCEKEAQEEAEKGREETKGKDEKQKNTKEKKMIEKKKKKAKDSNQLSTKGTSSFTFRMHSSHSSRFQFLRTSWNPSSAQRTCTAASTWHPSALNCSTSA